MNELLWIGFVLINFLMITLCYKLFGKTGLFAWIALGVIVANIQVTKTITLFNMTATLGNIMYGTLFLVTDALSEKYGEKEAKRAVYIGFFALISMFILMQYTLLFVPSEFDFAQEPLETIFDFMFRLVLGSIIAYIVSQRLDVYLFQRIKTATNSRFLFIRNNGSTLISQFIDTLIFVPIAFLGVTGFTNTMVIEIFITTYFIKLLVSVLDTPFIYWIKSIKPINE